MAKYTRKRWTLEERALLARTIAELAQRDGWVSSAAVHDTGRFERRKGSIYAEVHRFKKAYDRQWNMGDTKRHDFVAEVNDRRATLSEAGLMLDPTPLSIKDIKVVEGTLRGKRSATGTSLRPVNGSFYFQAKPLDLNTPEGKLFFLAENGRMNGFEKVWRNKIKDMRDKYFTDSLTPAQASFVERQYSVYLESQRRRAG